MPCHRFLSCSFSPFQFRVNTFVCYPRVEKNALKFRKGFILACFHRQEMEREGKLMCFGDFAVPLFTEAVRKVHVFLQLNL